MGTSCCCGSADNEKVDFGSKICREVDYQQRLDKIIDFWFSCEDDIGV